MAAFNEKQKKQFKKLGLAITAIILVYLGVRIFVPHRFDPAVAMSGRYAWEMISIFPAVLLLMGLADTWLPSSLIKKYLGRSSGFKGKLLAIGLGSLPTGPMFVAFPLAAELLRKEASISNVTIFLGVWASLKIPQIGIEIKFLGIKFAILRFIFTLISLLLIGFIIERVIDQKNLKGEVKI